VKEAGEYMGMKKDLDNCLHFHSFPPEIWGTTIILERELCRRTRPLNNFFTKEARPDFYPL
jgi:hypothetical protein